MGFCVLNRLICIVVFIEFGWVLLDKLYFVLIVIVYDCEQWFKLKLFIEQVQNVFSSGLVLVLICVIGIVVCILVFVICDKKSDLLVLVLDESGKFVILILFGYEGGVN